MAGLEGIDKVLAELARQTQRIKGSTASGVVKAALLIMRESQKLVPTRLGNLRNSRYLVTNIPELVPDIGGGAFKGEEAGKMASRHAQDKAAALGQVLTNAPTAAVGYSAVYALAVHENPRAGAAGSSAAADEARANTKVPLGSIHSKKGQWKFLEGPLKANAPRIIEIIKREAEIK